VAGWEAEKRQTDPYLPMVKAICGVYVIGEAPLEEDRDHNTDLMVLTIGGLRIGVRLRSPHYWNKQYKGLWFREEFTMRDSRPHGAATEWDKMLEGFGDYFFYGFRTERPPHLWGFGLLHLAEFRTWVLQFRRQWQAWPGRQVFNGDGSSTFRAIRWDQVPPSAIVTMYPAKIAVTGTLMDATVQQSIQLALALTLDVDTLRP
jgi:hypothetical protein